MTLICLVLLKKVSHFLFVKDNHVASGSKIKKLLGDTLLAAAH